MGRYLQGTAGFAYKYLFGIQPDNLDELARVAGRGGLSPRFIAHGAGENVGVACMPLLRTAYAEIGGRGELSGVAIDGDFAPSPTLEFIQYALGEGLVPVCRDLDAALPWVPDTLSLGGIGAYTLARGDWPALFAHVESRLASATGPRLRGLDDLRDKGLVDRAWEALHTLDDGLPAMGLWVLAHAVRHDLAVMAVSERQPSVVADDFWSGAREWGPPIFGDARLTDVDELLARGIVLYYGGRHEDARASFRALVAEGDARADRWLRALGVSEADLAAAPRRPEGPPPAPARAAARRAELDRARAAVPPAIPATEPARAPVAAPPTKDAAEIARALIAAHRARDGVEITRVLAECAALGLSIDEHTLSGAMSVVIQTAPPASFANAYRHAARVATAPEHAIFAYNMACLAARARMRPELLRWAQVAVTRGESRDELLADADLAEFGEDPDLRAILAPNTPLRERAWRTHDGYLVERGPSAKPVPSEFREVIPVGPWRAVPHDFLLLDAQRDRRELFTTEVWCIEYDQGSRQYAVMDGALRRLDVDESYPDCARYSVEVVRDGLDEVLASDTETWTQIQRALARDAAQLESERAQRQSESEARVAAIPGATVDHAVSEALNNAQQRLVHRVRAYADEVSAMMLRALLQFVALPREAPVSAALDAFVSACRACTYYTDVAPPPASPAPLEALPPTKPHLTEIATTLFAASATLRNKASAQDWADAPNTAAALRSAARWVDHALRGLASA